MVTPEQVRDNQSSIEEPLKRAEAFIDAELMISFQPEEIDLAKSTHVWWQKIEQAAFPEAEIESAMKLGELDWRVKLSLCARLRYAIKKLYDPYWVVTEHDDQRDGSSLVFKPRQPVSSETLGYG